jgi:hypothetical protein
MNGRHRVCYKQPTLQNVFIVTLQSDESADGLVWICTIIAFGTEVASAYVKKYWRINFLLEKFR